MTDTELAQWNERVPEGTAVIFRRGDGSDFHTRTRSIAWMLGGHTPVVQIEGVASCVPLIRITPQLKETDDIQLPGGMPPT